MENLKHKLAKGSGLSLLLMALLAGLAYGYILMQFGTVETALSWPDQQAASSLFALGIISWFTILALDLFLSYAFYRLYPSKLGRLSALMRLIYSLVLGWALISLVKAFYSLGDHTGLSAVSAHIETFNNIWSQGLIIFGVHLFLLAALVPLTWLKVLLGLAGISYTIVHAGLNYWPEANTIFQSLETALALPMALGELSFALVLLFKPVLLFPKLSR